MKQHAKLPDGQILGQNEVRAIPISSTEKYPGKKAGKLAISLTRDGYAEFELRVDTHRGVWFVVEDGMMHVARDKDILRRHLQQMLEARRAVRWTRYIVVDYEAETPGEFTERSRITRSRSGAPGSGHEEIGSIRLDWRVEDFSDPVAIPGRSSSPKRRLVYRGLDDDPNATPESESEGHAGDDGWVHEADGEGRVTFGPRYGREQWLHDAGIPNNAIPYTRARLDVLMEVRRALGRLDATLADMLDPAAGGAKLDALAERLAGITLLALSTSADGDRDEEGGLGNMEGDPGVPPRP
jgi:hypothetical protein